MSVVFFVVWENFLTMAWVCDILNLYFERVFEHVLKELCGNIYEQQESRIYKRNAERIHNTTNQK